MDFGSITSALGLGGEFNTPVGALIEKATSESLVNTDWALNMQICDEVRVGINHQAVFTLLVHVLDLAGG